MKYSHPYLTTNFSYRVTLPSEALPATVLEIDETDKVVNDQPRIVIKDSYNGEDIVLRTKKQSKGSSLSVSRSADLVNEELDKMEQAESLDVLSSSVRDNYSIAISQF